MDFDKTQLPDGGHIPIVDIDGAIETGKQFDIDITLPEDNRNVVYGIVKDSYGDPVKNAVVKLVEIKFDHGEKELRPVSHTFTDKEGEFVFGPLCPERKYTIQIWVNKVKHFKVCAKIPHEAKCLKGVKLDCDKYFEAEANECDCLPEGQE